MSDKYGTGSANTKFSKKKLCNDKSNSSNKKIEYKSKANKISRRTGKGAANCTKVVHNSKSNCSEVLKCCGDTHPSDDEIVEKSMTQKAPPKESSIPIMVSKAVQTLPPLTLQLDALFNARESENEIQGTVTPGIPLLSTNSTMESSLPTASDSAADTPTKSPNSSTDTSSDTSSNTATINGEIPHPSRNKALKTAFSQSLTLAELETSYDSSLRRLAYQLSNLCVTTVDHREEEVPYTL